MVGRFFSHRRVAMMYSIVLFEKYISPINRYYSTGIMVKNMVLLLRFQEAMSGTQNIVARDELLAFFGLCAVSFLIVDVFGVLPVPFHLSRATELARQVPTISW